MMTLRKQQIITKNPNRIFTELWTNCALGLRIRRKKIFNKGIFDIQDKNQPITTSFLEVAIVVWTLHGTIRIVTLAKVSNTAKSITTMTISF